ncbi:oxidoreductase [Streptococcus sp. ST16]
MGSDHEEAKNTIAQALAASDLAVKDAGSLKRAREQITWTGGFAILN